MAPAKEKRERLIGREAQLSDTSPSTSARTLTVT
jgi:hypothetical protein